MASPSVSLTASVMESVLGRVWWLPSSESAALSFEGCLGLGGLSRPHFFSTGSRYFFSWSPVGGEGGKNKEISLAPKSQQGKTYNAQPYFGMQLWKDGNRAGHKACRLLLLISLIFSERISIQQTKPWSLLIFFFASGKETMDGLLINRSTLQIVEQFVRNCKFNCVVKSTTLSREKSLVDHMQTCTALQYLRPVIIILQ